jgi:hypothetical protein
LQIDLAGASDAIVVRTIEPLSGIYEQDTIKVYGVVAGYEPFENRVRGTVSQPSSKRPSS